MPPRTRCAYNKQTTKDRILDAAERLFADKGLDGSSLRDITTAASANLAAVNYHFGSKNGLIDAVFARHLGPMNAARIALLDRVESRAGASAPAIEAVLDAFIRPVVMHDLADPGGNDAFMRLMSRCLNEPPTHIDHVKHHFDALMDRFHTAFSRALPDHSPSEIFWGLHFTIGIMHHTLHVLSRVNHLPHCPSEPADAQTVAEHLIVYTAAGMKAQHSCSNYAKKPCDAVPEVSLSGQHKQTAGPSPS